MVPDNIDEILYRTFEGRDYVYSVYSGGSYTNGDFDPERSDIDLSIILDQPTASEMLELKQAIEGIRPLCGQHISTCYADVSQLEMDLDKFGVGIYGKKRSSFLYDIINKERICGEDMGELVKENVSFHPFELYSNIAELTDAFYNKMALDSHAVRKCTNISLVVAKTILILNGKYELSKPQIIDSFTQNIDQKLGEQLKRIYLGTGEDEETFRDSLEFMQEFITHCNNIAREIVEVKPDEIREIQETK